MSIGKQALKGVIFVTLSNNIVFLFSFVANNIILARLLPIEAFGQFALATFFVSLVGRVRELGFDYAVVHAKQDLVKIGSVYLTLQILLGVIVAIITVPASLLVSEFYGVEVGLATLLLGFGYLITNIYNSLNALFDKELRFQESAVIGVVSTAVSILGMVIMGLGGYGLWSLIIGGIPGSILGLLLLFAKLKFSYHWDLDPEIVKWFYSFGPWWHWFISATASLLVFQFDNFIVGNIVGLSVLGFYTRAYSWATMPTSRITAIISKVAFPVYARLQEDKEKLSKAFSLTLSTIALLTIPLSLVSVLVIREAILVLVGEKWLDMIPLFYLLLGYMLLRPIFDDAGALLTAVGKPKIINTAQLIQSGVMISVTTLLVYLYGGIGAPIGVGIVMMAGVGYLYRHLLAVVDVNPLKIFLVPSFCGLVSLVVTFYLKKFFFLSFEPLITLILTGMSFSVCYIGLIVALKGRSIYKQMIDFRKVFVE